MRAILLAAVLLTGDPVAAPAAPARFVDVGACPFECCTYRDWTTGRTTLLRARPDPQADVVGAAQRGHVVHALTGEVVTSRPGRFRVLVDHDGSDGVHYRAGEVVNVYTYLGEGVLRVWHDGAMHQEELGFMPSDGMESANASSCGHEACWGRPESMPRSVWWVKVRTARGLIGWTNQPEHFGNADACG